MPTWIAVSIAASLPLDMPSKASGPPGGSSSCKISRAERSTPDRCREAGLADPAARNTRPTRRQPPHRRVPRPHTRAHCRPIHRSARPPRKVQPWQGRREFHALVPMARRNVRTLKPAIGVTSSSRPALEGCKPYRSRRSRHPGAIPLPTADSKQRLSTRRASQETKIFPGDYPSRRYSLRPGESSRSFRLSLPQVLAPAAIT